MAETHILDKSVALITARRPLCGVRAAAQSLAEDIEEVCGFRPALHETKPQAAKLTILIESDKKLARQLGLEAKLSAPESFLIRAIRPDGRDAILISGADERGTIHGIYHFSHANLGTDPLKFWTEFKPARRPRIVLKNADYDSVPATFRWRGFHMERMNDLHHWVTQDASAERRFMWAKAMETILRLRGNMVKSEPNLPESPEVALAQKMGLMVTQEHWSPLGVSGYDIRPNDPNFRFSLQENRDVFMRAWDEGIQRYPRPENVIWTLGFRGRGDRPFWEFDPASDTDAKRGEMITAAMRAQMELVRKRCGRFNPIFIYNLWMEGVQFVREGHVKVPEGVICVWADNGYGTFRGMLPFNCDTSHMHEALPEKPVAGTHGVYCHVSMYDMNAPDLEQFVPPARIRREFIKVMQKEATAYLLVNVGRIREQVLGAAAVMEVGDDAAKWTHPGFNGAEDYWNRWCRKYFGAHAAAARKCYDALYNTPFKWGEWIEQTTPLKSSWDDYVIGEIGYYRRARMFVEEALHVKVRKRWETARFKFWGGKAIPLREQLDYMLATTGGVVEKWKKARADALALWRKLRGASKDFFEVNVLAQIEIHMFSNLYLIHMTEAVALYEDQKYRDAEPKVLAAQEDMRQVRAAMDRMEKGPWAKRYKDKYWSGWHMANSTAEMFLRVVREFQLVRKG